MSRIVEREFVLFYIVKYCIYILTTFVSNVSK